MKPGMPQLRPRKWPLSWPLPCRNQMRRCERSNERLSERNVSLRDPYFTNKACPEITHARLNSSPVRTSAVSHDGDSWHSGDPPDRRRPLHHHGAQAPRIRGAPDHGHRVGGAKDLRQRERHRELKHRGQRTQRRAATPVSCGPSLCPLRFDYRVTRVVELGVEIRRSVDTDSNTRAWMNAPSRSGSSMPSRASAVRISRARSYGTARL